MFKSTLKFQSKEFDIRFVDYEIKRDVDAIRASGFPSVWWYYQNYH